MVWGTAGWRRPRGSGRPGSGPVLAILCLALLLASPAFAQEVEPRSGRLLVDVADLVVRAGPTNLAIGRWLGADTPGLLGSKWTLSLDSRLTRDEDGVQIQDGSSVKQFAPEA